MPINSNKNESTLASANLWCIEKKITHVLIMLSSTFSPQRSKTRQKLKQKE